MNKIKGPQLFSLYATYVGKNLILISSHIHPQTHNTNPLALDRSNYQLIKKDNPQGFSSIQSTVRMNLIYKMAEQQ